MIFLKHYFPKAPGVRFKKRIYWTSTNKITRVNLIINQVLKYKLKRVRKKGVQSKVFCIDWLRLYHILSLMHIIVYSKQNKTGLAIVSFFNKSLACWSAVDNLNMLRSFFFLTELKSMSVVSNIELRFKGGIQLIRSAGTRGRLLKFLTKSYYVIKLPSGHSIPLNIHCRGRLGRNYNILKNRENYSKAGTTMRLGRHPKVRGVAMNAGDHPHGGRSGPSGLSKSPWGWYTK